MTVFHPRDGGAAAPSRVDDPTRPLPDATRAPLVLTIGARRVPLGARTLTIGAGAHCDVVLDDPTVSATHCRIVPTRQGWQVRDAGSTNGTRVSGARVEAAMLAPGLALVLGRTRILCACAPGHQPAGPGAAPAPGVAGGVALVGASPAMEQVRHDIARHAPRDYPVLIQGETGSGKELVARLVHTGSRRARGAFVALNAAAIAPELVESELFGHERGAFTGAQTRRRGVFEEATGGTLFLDEIGELPLGQQAKLLRVLETGEVRRVGGEGVVRVDVRVVCATHRDLAARAEAGHFRRDLLYRLDVLRVRLPPLRERLDDLPALARHLLARIAADVDEPKTLDDAAMAVLLSYGWPGNVRELYGALCRAASLAEGERVGAEHLALAAAPTATPAAGLDSSAGAPPGATHPEDLGRGLTGSGLRSLVASCDGNLSRAARVTGLARSTLRDRLQRAQAGG